MKKRAGEPFLEESDELGRLRAELEAVQCAHQRTVEAQPDITELKRAEEEIRNLNETLERRVLERTAQLEAANRELEGEILERKRAEEALKLNEERLEALLKLSRMKDLSEGDLIDYALEECVRLTRSKAGYLHFVNEDRESIRLCSWSRTVRDACRTGGTMQYPLSRAGVWADCVRIRRAVIHNDYRNLVEKKGYPEGHFQVLRHMSVPVLDNDRVVAIAGVGNKEEPYNESDVRQLALFMNSLWNTLKQKRDEEALKRAKEEAEAAHIAKSQFLANMSHELRTPLNAIIGFTGLILDKHLGDVNEHQEEFMSDVLTSGRHLLALIDEILDLSNMEAGKFELFLSDLDLKSLLLESLGMVQEKAMKHSIRLLTDFDSIPAMIEADKYRLKQIVYNLLSNAVKFTPDGGKVHLSARCITDADLVLDDYLAQFLMDLESERFVEISVKDTGIGIKSEDLGRIFKPFEQVDGSSRRRFTGAGLGLSLSRELVELHGGRIWAESEGEGAGSTFRFIIPF